MNKLKFSYQYDEMDCGPACFRMIASTFGIQLSSAEVKKQFLHSKNGD
jgi:ABC-type bacteriocin/lantibiotic exporter with double-glycine peptidase domain